MVTLAEAQAAEASLQQQIADQQARRLAATNENERIKAINTVSQLSLQLKQAHIATQNAEIESRRESLLASGASEFELRQAGVSLEQQQHFVGVQQSNVRASIGQEQLVQKGASPAQIAARFSPTSVRAGAIVEQRQFQQQKQQVFREAEVALQNERLSAEFERKRGLSPEAVLSQGRTGTTVQPRAPPQPQRPTVSSIMLKAGGQQKPVPTPMNGGLFDTPPRIPEPQLLDFNKGKIQQPKEPITQKALNLFGFRSGKGFEGTLFQESISNIPGTTTFVSPGFAKKLESLGPKGPQPEFIQRQQERERILTKPVFVGQFTPRTLSKKEITSQTTAGTILVNSLNPFAQPEIRKARQTIVIPQRRQERQIQAQQQVNQRAFDKIGKDLLGGKLTIPVKQGPIQEGISFGARFLVSPAVGLGKIALEKLVVRETAVTKFAKKKFAQGFGPTIKPLFFDPDVQAFGITGILAAAPPLVISTAGVVFTGITGARAILKPSPQTIGEFAVSLPFGIAGGVQLARQTRLATQLLSGKAEFVNPENVFAGEVLRGESTFPKVKSVNEALRRFGKAREQGTRRILTAHTTASRFVEGPVKKGPEALRGLEDPGLFVSPGGEASPFFLRLGTPVSGGVELRLFPPFTQPKVVEIPIKRIARQPLNILRQPGFAATEEFLGKQAGRGTAFITKRLEAAFKPGLKVTSTREIEAVIPVGTEIVKVFEPRPRITKFKGVLIPIERFEITGRVIPPKEFGRQARGIERAGRGFESLSRGELNIFPTPSRARTSDRRVQRALTESFNRAFTGRPTILRPETIRLETARPEKKRLEITRPEIGRLEIARPDLFRPDLFRPEIARLDLGRPDIFRPNRVTPEITRTPPRGKLGLPFYEFGRPRPQRKRRLPSKFTPSLLGITRGIRIKKIPGRTTGLDVRGIPINLPSISFLEFLGQGFQRIKTKGRVFNVMKDFRPKKIKLFTKKQLF